MRYNGLLHKLCEYDLSNTILLRDQNGYNWSTRTKQQPYSHRQWD